jgi:hypothetical protein
MAGASVGVGSSAVRVWGKTRPCTLDPSPKHSNDCFCCVCVCVCVCLYVCGGATGNEGGVCVRVCVWGGVGWVMQLYHRQA